MHRGSQIILIVLSAGLLLAAESPWKSKPVTQWNNDDARHVLASSPWAKVVAPAQLPHISEARLREAGRMGGTKGVGFDDLGLSILTGVGRNKPAVTRKAGKRETVTVRWESAPVVRSAESKIGEENAPDWEGSYYVIAVYGVPGLADVDLKSLYGDLKKGAYLKREGKTDVKPVDVEILQEGHGMATIVYLFPTSIDITSTDQRVGFVAQIGRLFVAPFFYPPEMQFDGKLEL